MVNTGQTGPQKVDIILRGGTVLTMDDARRIVSPGSVAISGREIVAVGAPADLAEEYDATRTIDCSSQVIMPGLVNTHTHVPMTLLRGLADDLRLDVWLYGYILPVEREFVNPEFCFLGATLAYAEMLRGGTTCFADMYYFEDEVAWAAEQVGIRGVCGETITKLPTPDAGSYEESLCYCADFMSRWQGHDLIVATPAPHSVYMCTAEILEQTTALARQFDVTQLIHVSETADEVAQWVEQTSMRPVRWLEEHGMLEAKTTAAHCVHVNSEEIHILADHRTGVAHNPTSNLKLASGIAPVSDMLAAGVAVGTGTDGSASNDDLDMFEEMRLAGLLPKGISNNPVAVPAQDAVAMATINGARALHLDHLIGSLEPGKRADVIVVNSENVHSLPHYETTGLNVYSRLVYTGHACDVLHVFVNGRQLVSDGALEAIDERQVIEQAVKVAGRVNKFFVARERSVLDKLVAIGGLLQQETFEVQGKGTIASQEAFEAGLGRSDVHVTRQTVRDQYDTYFVFADASQGRLRYREDNVLNADGSVDPIYNLTLTGPSKEAEYENSVLLSRSRYTAPADRSLRFYREYFQPADEYEIAKRRERYHIRFKGVDFAVNLDRIRVPEQPDLYVEIKSRTWSQQDAVRKAELIGELLPMFGVASERVIREEYMDLFVT